MKQSAIISFPIIANLFESSLEIKPKEARCPLGTIQVLKGDRNAKGWRTRNLSVSITVLFPK
jgi:hypothetical protein